MVISRARGQERHRLGGEAFDLAVALLIGADEVENDVTGSHLMKPLHGLGDLLRCAERAVALGGFAEVHGVALAERDGRGVERLVVGVVDAREQEMRRAEAALEDAIGFGRG